MAASTSKKHDNFVREPMLPAGRPKSVDELPGIGPKAKGELAERGFEHAHQLLGQLLIFDRDQDLFLAFLKDSIPCLNWNPKHYTACYNCLNEWCCLNL